MIFERIQYLSRYFPEISIIAHLHEHSFWKFEIVKHEDCQNIWKITNLDWLSPHTVTQKFQEIHPDCPK